MTKLNAALDRLLAAQKHCLARLSAAIYDTHSEHCTTCCVLGGEFCRTGRLLCSLAEQFETEQLW
ncbi:MAG TPA: hypothetical protein VL551_11800 [Actinospica sp.]|jgi:hypothetical protein|nr:hypothetical protein [Actinospica sp.]